jgi:hypothetical protein
MPLLTTQSARGYGWGAGGVVSDTAYESIQTVYIASGSQASIDFTSIPSTYKHLQIRCLVKSTRALYVSGLYFRINGDTGSNYAYHVMYGDDTTSSYSSAAATYGNAGTITGDTQASTFGAGIIDIYDYANTSKRKTIRSHVGTVTNAQGEATYTGTLWNSTSTISSINMFTEAGNIMQYSHFALYGIKG